MPDLRISSIRRALGLDHREPDPGVEVARRLLVGGRAEPLPGGEVALVEPLPDQVDDALRVVVLQLLELVQRGLGRLLEQGGAGQRVVERVRARARRSRRASHGSVRPWMKSVPATTVNAISSSTSRCVGVVGDDERRRQRDHAAHAGPAEEEGVGPRRSLAGQRVGPGADEQRSARGRPRPAAARCTATRVAAQTATIRPPRQRRCRRRRRRASGPGARSAGRRRSRAGRRSSASSIRSAIRDCAVCRIGALWPEQQAGDDDRDHARRRAAPRRPGCTPRTGPRTRVAVSSTGSLMRRRTQATTRKTREADQHAADRPRHEVERRPATAATPPAATASAVRRATSAVASLSSDSPSRIVTIRRGSPIRRPIAVAATASGGATTAPIANAIGHETPGQQRVHDHADAEGREDDQPDREQQDRAPVGVEVDQRRLDRGGVEQRRQQPEQHDLGLEVDLGHARRGRTPATPATMSTSGGGRSIRSANAVTARTPTASATRKKCDRPRAHLGRRMRREHVAFADGVRPRPVAPPSASGRPSRARRRRAGPAPARRASAGGRRR